MSAPRTHDEVPERRAAAAPRQDGSAGAGGALARTHAPTGPADPRLAHAGAAVPGLFALQRSAGNAAVASMVGPDSGVQRAVEIGEIETSVGVQDPTQELSPEVAAQIRSVLPGMIAEAQQGPPAGGGPGGGVTSDGGTTTVTGGVVNISGGAVNIDAAMTHASGVVQADTVVANSIVASSYTPGAGNTW
jgi:hypothetical protein